MRGVYEDTHASSVGTSGPKACSSANLLAKRCAQVLDAVQSLDIFVMLGLGEVPGEGAVRWTVGNLNKRFEAPGVPGMVTNLADPKTTLFPSGYGTRRAYRFDFADQHVLTRTLGIERVATRLYERVGLKHSFEPLSSVTSLVSDFGEMFEVASDPTFVPSEQDRFDV